MNTIQIIRIENDLIVFGRQVKTFPLGISEAFDELVNTLPDGANRSYYGISYLDKNGGVVYIAAAEEKLKGEAELHGYEAYKIDKGEYRAVMIKNWRPKTNMIKDVFEDILSDYPPDAPVPCVEWYKNDEEMFCMVRINSTVLQKK